MKYRDNGTPEHCDYLIEDLEVELNDRIHLLTVGFDYRFEGDEFGGSEEIYNEWAEANCWYGIKYLNRPIQYDKLSPKFKKQVEEAMCETINKEA